ncbi:MFS transporter [Candidatus Woesearchaeota archaeon]|nr:MFS transporter [Candidatus Woesearchaeota archaeon]
MKKDYASNIWKYYLFIFFGRVELTVSIFVLFFLGNNLNMIQVMILETIFTIALFLFEIPSGAFADKVGRKASLALSNISLCVAFVLFGLGNSFFIFIIAQIFCALFWALKSGADSAFIYDSLKEIKRENEYARIFGIGSSIWAFTLAGLSIISTTLSVYLGYRMLFFISAGFFFVGFLIALTFKEPPIHKHLQESNYFKHIKKAIKFTYTHKIIRNLIIYYGLFAALGHLTYFLIQPYYTFTNLSINVLGIAMTCLFLFEGLGFLFAQNIIKRFTEKKLLFLLMFIGSISFIAIFLFSPFIAIIFISLMSFSCGVRDIFIEKEIHIHTESHHRATVISVQSISKSIMYAIFAPLIGLFTDIYSPAAAFLMMGIGMFIFLIYITFLFKFYKKSPTL